MSQLDMVTCWMMKDAQRKVSRILTSRIAVATQLEFPDVPCRRTTKYFAHRPCQNIFGSFEPHRDRISSSQSFFTQL